MSKGYAWHMTPSVLMTGNQVIKHLQFIKRKKIYIPLASNLRQPFIYHNGVGYNLY